jgi:hypothetical protein
VNLRCIGFCIHIKRSRFTISAFNPATMEAIIMSTAEQGKTTDDIATRTYHYNYYTLTVEVREDKLPAVVKEIVTSKDVRLVKAEMHDEF